MSIKAIDAVSVHKICSGQVITDLSSAVKELIENALDAGATVIEVKLKNQGADSIEVSDNGGGIDSSNYAGLAMKHHTSKLLSFSDLKSVASFGFRGEALNALCELSGDFGVVTRQKSEPIASSLTFRRNGELEETVKASRAPGTTVTVTNLFELLPVRRAELLRSLKKQYVRLLKLVQSYAVISVGVKIALYTTDKGGRNAVIDTRANSTLPENISFVFGSKFLQTLIPVEVDVTLPDGGDDLDDHGMSAEHDDGEIDADKAAAGSTSVKIVGYISKAGVGVGRSDNDRQFMFCNGRPVDLPKLTRTMNEIWRKYEMKQKPAFVLNVTTPAGTFDVNISPDKREIVLTHEDLIIDKLKEAVDSVYESSRFTFQVNMPSDSSTQLQLSAFSSQPQESSGPSVPAKTRASALLRLEHNDEGIPLIVGTPSRRSDRVDLLDPVTSSTVDEPTSPELPVPGQHVEIITDNEIIADTVTVPDAIVVDNSIDDTKKRKQPTEEPERAVWDFDSAAVLKRVRRNVDFRDPRVSTLLQTQPVSAVSNTGQNSEEVVSARAGEEGIRVLSKEDFREMEVLGQFNLGFIIAQLRGDLYILDQHACDEKYRFETLQESTIIHQQPLIQPMLIDLTCAEEIVVMENMNIFAANGFKIAVDASLPSGQRVKLLAVPFSKGVQFGVEDVRELASMLMDDFDGSGEFRSNLSMRHSATTHGGQSQATDNAAENMNMKSKNTVRLPKLLTMYASRACRQSVMIGTALSEREMVGIIRQLVGIEQPWNCPHGRPTMRHLADIAMINDTRDN